MALEPQAVHRRPRLRHQSVARRAGWIAALLCAAAFSQSDQQASGGPDTSREPPAEFHMVRVKYATMRGGGSHGWFQPFWAIDYPLAEGHFLRALRRLTTVSAFPDTLHLELSDPRIFDHPFLFLQQPAKGGWRPNAQDVANLREYLLRGGFLLVDDFHGEYEWAMFQDIMRRIFPDRAIVEIPADDPVMNVVFNVDRGTPIPGRRHVWSNGGGAPVIHMEGPSHWRGIYDDGGRLMVMINFNIDMGDSWEHEDDPEYPLANTAMGYRFGVNYVVYAMTH